MIPDKDKLTDAIAKKIEREENIGEKAGSSGHLGMIDYSIDQISEPVPDGENYIMTYRYTLSITTEFTIYPDNPPHESTRELKVIVDKNACILKTISSEMVSTNYNPF